MNFNKDEISFKVLTDWSSAEYKCESQKTAALQCLINSVLENTYNLAIDEAVKAANSFNGCEVVSWKIEGLKQ
jgi:hypothetical protein